MRNINEYKNKNLYEKNNKKFFSLILKLLVFFIGLIFCAISLLSIAITMTWSKLPNLNALTDYKPRLPLRIYTADHILLGEFGEERRNLLKYNEIPDIMKLAVLAAEDDRFYSHKGIDWFGVIRAGLANISHMAKIQGASTITMQVARNFYLSSEKTYSRKFYEFMLTFKIESELTKDQILELYMNQIYLGHRSYGFAAAAITYFGKSINEINVAEAALLAGIPKAPSIFNPFSNYKRSTNRQKYILGRMLLLNYINKDEYNNALQEKICLKDSKYYTDDQSSFYNKDLLHGEYAAELVRQLLFNIYKNDLYSSGINVYTTIKSKDQIAAYKAVRDGVISYTKKLTYLGEEDYIDLPVNIESDIKNFQQLISKKFQNLVELDGIIPAIILYVSDQKIILTKNGKDRININDQSNISYIKNCIINKSIRRGSIVYIYRNILNNWEIINFPKVQAALVSMSPNNGAIFSLVGGFDFYLSKFNHVTQAWRQAGSSIKPFIYAAALEKGVKPSTRISDQPFIMTAEETGSKAWNPKNYGNKYEDKVTMRQSLYKSKNMASIRILEFIGPEFAKEYLAKFGFDKNKHPALLPLALGAGSVTPLQLVNAFSIFANGGYLVSPYLIDKVTDNDGNILMQCQPIKAGDNDILSIDKRVAYIMDDMLKGVATKGTARKTNIELKRHDIAGKTGTTNNSFDAWFAGYNQSISATTWVGFDNLVSLGDKETGGAIAMPIWINYMKEALKGVPEDHIREVPEGIELDEDGDFFLPEIPTVNEINDKSTSNNDTEILSSFLDNFTKLE
ncbi:Penicillin-binding protein 1A [Candidatus Kinetoplastibacterium sorsogonicusi]|uniref:peptidoglycan glycosyltransferase n=1 Tax=Candidatus Kinetoplastidibacterium kentomonadis TaxID=1576550 RepID=A0A3S7JAR8_9PROT|nr:PBP1A family penicillin-binding protein [Candidatus Kinetoplastibacterium sorsogonicusi]AWD32767.1 Penicillin-binding protein 1A [Candidatus Kinetoplastibacterium sorsogonicusi]